MRSSTPTEPSAAGSIALAEVQAYVFGAYTRAARSRGSSIRRAERTAGDESSQG